MRLTTKGRFAVTAMLDVALQAQGGPVTLSNIAERQKISLSYLEQLFAKLRRAQLVESVRGPGGGYYLARLPEDTSVADIIVAVEEQMDSRQCEGKENCRGEGASKRRCMTHDLWESLNENVLQFLSGVSLADLVQQQSQAEVQVVHGPMNLARTAARDQLVSHNPSPSATEAATSASI
jgi:Rrf2 family transcriptional regulator, iron-sulfur cluster assembly transcription factor